MLSEVLHLATLPAASLTVEHVIVVLRYAAIGRHPSYPSARASGLPCLGVAVRSWPRQSSLRRRGSATALRMSVSTICSRSLGGCRCSASASRSGAACSVTSIRHSPTKTSLLCWESDGGSDPGVDVGQTQPNVRQFFATEHPLVVPVETHTSPAAASSTLVCSAVSRCMSSSRWASSHSRSVGTALPHRSGAR